MRVILDTNLWSSIGDEMAARPFDALMKSHSLEVVVPPSILLEVMRIPVAEARDRVIHALGTGPRYRLPTEAQSESAEVVSETRRVRPHWMRSMPDTARVWSLNNFWTNKIWRAALENSQLLHERGVGAGQVAERDAIIRSQRTQRAEIIRTNFAMKHLTEIHASPSPDFPLNNHIPGWSGEPVEAWRVTCRYAYWYQLVTIGSRAVFTKEDSTYADWVGAYVDLAHLRSSPDDFTRFWLDDVSRDAVPRNWLRWAVNFVQTGFKVTPGNPVDEQHSSYLLDCDLFLSADSNYISVLEAIYHDSPFKVGEPRLVSGDRTFPVLERLEASL